jgi:hypothetical protein
MAARAAAPENRLFIGRNVREPRVSDGVPRRCRSVEPGKGLA